MSHNQMTGQAPKVKTERPDWPNKPFAARPKHHQPKLSCFSVKRLSTTFSQLKDMSKNVDDFPMRLLHHLDQNRNANARFDLIFQELGIPI